MNFFILFSFPRPERWITVYELDFFPTRAGHLFLPESWIYFRHVVRGWREGGDYLRGHGYGHHRTARVIGQRYTTFLYITFLTSRYYITCLILLNWIEYI